MTPELFRLLGFAMAGAYAAVIIRFIVKEPHQAGLGPELALPFEVRTGQRQRRLECPS